MDPALENKPTRTEIIKSAELAYSKINFNEYVNNSVSSPDVAIFTIQLEYAVLKATCILYKKPYMKVVRNMEFDEVINLGASYDLHRIEIINSSLIYGNDVVIFSPYRLLAAYEEINTLKINDKNQQ